MTPVRDDDVVTKDLFRSTAAQNYVKEQRRLEGIRQAPGVALAVGPSDNLIAQG